MGRMKMLALEIANELGRDDLGHDEVQVQFEIFSKAVMEGRSPCCEAKLAIINYYILECSSCKSKYEKDVIFNRPKKRDS